MKTMRLECSECFVLAKNVDTRVMRQRRKAGLPYACVCGADLIKTGKRIKLGRSDNQIRSKKQEQRIAKRLGARRQAGSGSVAGIKGDIRKAGEIRGECKFTRAKSFTLKLAELIKIERETEAGEDPAFFIEFQCQKPEKRYVVIPESLYEYYVGLAGEVCEE